MNFIRAVSGPTRKTILITRTALFRQDVLGELEVDTAGILLSHDSKLETSP